MTDSIVFRLKKNPGNCLFHHFHMWNIPVNDTLIIIHPSERPGSAWSLKKNSNSNAGKNCQIWRFKATKGLAGRMVTQVTRVTCLYFAAGSPDQQGNRFGCSLNCSCNPLERKVFFFLFPSCTPENRHLKQLNWLITPIAKSSLRERCNL